MATHQPGTDVTHYQDLARAIYGERDWIVAMGVLVGAGQTAQTLLDHGAARVLAIGASRGSGDLPAPELVPQHCLDVRGEDLMTSIRRGMDAVADLPADVQAAVDAFDPERSARVITEHFSDDRPVGGRSVYAARAPEWQALEDKMTVDALWDRAGVPRAAAEIIAPERSALRQARETVGTGGDVVVSGDSREGFNGGAEYVRWIRTEEQLERAAEFFDAHCDRVRVMPLLDGIVCSIHGIVFDDDVVVLRPCEMIVMRDPAAGRFLYASVATFWEAGPEATAEMRGVARRVGRTLRDEVDYRGAFTVDGVLTEGGFRPTELNPRFGAGLETMGRGLKGCPLYLINLGIMAGEGVDWRPRQLERLIIESATQHPVGGGARLTRQRIETTTKGRIVLTADAVRLADDNEPADAHFMIGPGPTGGRCRVDLDPERTPRGPVVTPRIARALEFLGQEFDLDLAPVAT